ncbi:MAG: site-2 protease family protein [Acidobacteria bacterium]|nr:site-2 protease family protein [Acidobacteriota bacterium]
MDAPERIIIDDLIERSLRPSAATWLKHIGFLLITLITTTVAGVLYPFGSIQVLPDADPQTFSQFIDFIVSLPAKYFLLIGSTVSRLLTDSSFLTDGLSFSLSLLFILIAHEMGHYVACRLYKVDATLPFFIPTPPMLGPAGTFGAFIKIRSPLPSRRAVFDIGVAGPIAGFVALIPIALIGVLKMQPASAEQLAESGIVFSNPLLVQFLAAAAGFDLSASAKGPFYYAAWVGALVTALNLIPSGQLDGGHAVFAVFDEVVHRWTGRIAFAAMAILSVLGFLLFNSPSGFLIAILLGVMMKIKHPVPWDQTPLDPKRKAVAFLTLMMFVLCFLPFPIKIL